MITWEQTVESESLGERTIVGEMCSGITAYRHGRALILKLPDGGFRVLSTGYHNGGFTDSPDAVVNMGTAGGKLEWVMMGDRETVIAYNNACFARLGLDPEKIVAEGTAANMVNASIGSVISDDIPVSIAITAGINGNGGCAGDPASFDEAERYIEKNGTIIMLLSVGADLSDTAMLQLMNIMVQAKSCVIQEMQAKSLYSHRIATGSGTDQIAIISDKHDGMKAVGDISIDSEFARGVVSLLRENLFRAFEWQANMTPTEQADILVQLSRIGLTMTSIKDEIRFPNRMKDLQEALMELNRDPYLVAMVTAILRIYDSIDAGVMDPAQGLDAAKRMALGALEGRLPENPVYSLRIEDAATIPEFLSLLCAMVIEYRATEIAEGRR